MSKKSERLDLVMDQEQFDTLYPLINAINETNGDSKLKLSIFDFDGTLFKSPEPNPDIWHASMIGKLKSMKSENGLGWFQETLTLDDPYVPKNPSMEWFNETVLNEALESIKTPNTITCLLTGRTFLYEEIIKRIVESVGLKFNYFGLKQKNPENGVERESTFEFKTRFINRIIQQYGERIDNIVVYEDRKNHVDLFKQLLATKGDSVKSEVRFIDEPVRYLEEEAEHQLVDALIAKNGIEGYQKKKMVSYTAAVLDHASHLQLLSHVKLPVDWEIKAHHTTMNLGAYSPKLWKLTQPVDLAKMVEGLTLESDPSKEEEAKIKLAEEAAKNYPIGSKVALTIEGFGLSGAAFAAKVSGVPTANAIPHITIAHHPRAKPVESNFIQNWKVINDELVSANKIGFVAPPPKPVETPATSPDGAVEPAPVTSPAKKQNTPFEYPSVEVGLLGFTQPFTVNAIIKEVGLTSYESSTPTPAKGKGAAQAGAGKNLPFMELINKHHTNIEKKDVGKWISHCKSWSAKEKCEDVVKLEEYIKSLTPEKL